MIVCCYLSFNVARKHKANSYNCFKRKNEASAEAHRAKGSEGRGRETRCHVASGFAPSLATCPAPGGCRCTGSPPSASIRHAGGDPDARQPSQGGQAAQEPSKRSTPRQPGSRRLLTVTARPPRSQAAARHPKRWSQPSQPSEAPPTQSYVRAHDDSAWRHRLVCKEFLCFNVMPCRRTLLLVHF